MSGIALSVQKVIMFIPFFNILNLFIFMYNSIRLGWSMGTTLKGAVTAVAYFLPVMLVQFILSQFFPEIAKYVGDLIVYFAILAMGYGLIRFQGSLDDFL